MKPSTYPVLLVALLLFLSDCTSSNRPENNLEANRELIRRYHQVWSDGHVSALDSILAPDFVYHFLGGMEYNGIAGGKNFINSHRTSFPDWKEEIVDMVAENDRIVTRYKSTGTHRGTFNGLDSTGRKIMISETSVYRIANGKLAEQWGFPDVMSLDNQLRAKK
ncbi:MULTISPECIES: ester cyclase [unclassified Spirosoma]|uniref:ester cyclase n=1 Tax=unclassified Spirosoma TaxID=2621999 RepID=UPI00095F7140|nr:MULTISPECIES: ester cyclase [unclassified Spirosoma]MBN8823755.1 ester cyclase [Spirosoma sp.]OJW76699.1 MAG: hypothetical protein BGO59_20890 [Spirosoma sp. 48-14]